jgi:hypothetical protein
MVRRLFKLALVGSAVYAAIVFLRRLLESDVGQVQEPSRQEARTRDELYREAARLDIPGRSKMDKRQLQKAVDEATSAGAA